MRPSDWFSRRKAVDVGVGVLLQPDSVTLARCARNGEEASAGDHVLQWTSKESSPAAWADDIAACARQLNLPNGAHAAIVLGPECYSLLLVEPPDVPAEEVADAVRWRVRDLLSFPVEEAVVDTFEFPPEAQRGRRLTFVVAARQEELLAQLKAVQSTRLSIDTVDIAELALRDVLQPEDQDNDAGIAVVHLSSAGGVIALLRGGSVYLSRRLDALDLTAQHGLDHLLLQVQRSLDYYESQLGQRSAGRVVLSASAEQATVVLKHFSDMLPLTVSTIDEYLAERHGTEYVDLIAGDHGASGLMGERTLALGAALRAAP